MTQVKWLAVVALVLIGVSAYFAVGQRPEYSIKDYLIPSGAQGNLSVPERDFRSTIDEAQERVVQLFARAKRFDQFQRGVAWVALGISSVVVVIAGFFGRRIDVAGEGVAAKDVLGIAARSSQLYRLVGILLALSTVAGFLSQQLEGEAKRDSADAKTLNQAIIEATQVLYSSSSTEVQARLALQKLKGEMSAL